MDGIHPLNLLLYNVNEMKNKNFLDGSVLKIQDSNSRFKTGAYNESF